MSASNPPQASTLETGNEGMETVLGLQNWLSSQHQRPLERQEIAYLEKLEKRWHRYQQQGVIHDHDVVRLNSKWPIQDYEPLQLWPSSPKSLVEFWNYLAWHFKKRRLPFPSFMRPLIHSEWVSEKMHVWELEKEQERWEAKIQQFLSAPTPSQPQTLHLRLVFTTSEAKLQSLRPDSEPENAASVSWTDVSKETLENLMTSHKEGHVQFDPASEFLWMRFMEAWGPLIPEPRLRFERQQNCVWANQLLTLAWSSSTFGLNERLVTLDDLPMTLSLEELHWQCRLHDEAHYSLDLTTSQETPSYSLRLFPGTPNYYFSGDTVLKGPPPWTLETTEINPATLIPVQAVETDFGVEFLSRIQAQIPDSLKDRIEESRMLVALTCRLLRQDPSIGTEQLLIEAHATDQEARREEVLKKEGWEITRQTGHTPGKLRRFDRSALQRFPAAFEPLSLVWDANHESFRGRVTKHFPDRFLSWLKSLPQDTEVRLLDPALRSLERDPIRARVRFEVQDVEKSLDWFDLRAMLEVEDEDFSDADLRALVAARGDFVRLENGEWRRLELQLEFEQKEAIDRLGLDVYDLTKQNHRVHLLQVKEAGETDLFDAQTWSRLKDRVQSLIFDHKPPTPQGLNATLRPYQVDGYHFLSYLSANRFGGILADDMGLGKTIQSLSWILHLREQDPENPKPSLVVCPKSVLDVWEAEGKKFTPSLNVSVLREASTLDISKIGKEIDLLVINYSQLRSCIDELTLIHWDAVILDEGQQIKNPDSRAAKAARSLTSNHRLVLTGTPIENRLLDIWSLMAFAMPGVLGDRAYFSRNFDRRKDPMSHDRLTSRLRPFLLRRTKKQVLHDLPPRTEEDVYCEMSAEQHELYQLELRKIQESLLLRLQRREDSSMLVLQALMRLRQICCHPGLISDENNEAESAKFEALFYLLEQLREEGHKVLVFSQFVTMLDLIKGRLQSEGHPFSYLTGQTRNRHEVVENFQTTDQPEVFLLSLKAGGTGLNLTAASYVILYDPWWNPAVENQAIDRTHRIGQNSPVMAYRLLTKGTIEEKIRVLQQRKQALSNNILGDEGFARNLNENDLAYLFDLGSLPASKEDDS